MLALYWISDSPNTTSFEFEIEKGHPLVTLVTMIAPSPDWFVGVAGLDLQAGGEWAPEVVVDLGAWWEEETGLPIPLGCIAARAELGEGRKRDIEELIRRSIRLAQENPEPTLPYIRRYAGQPR